ncbi:STAS domain-containing protein [uncultured Reyranella sp.]|uniref:STAS domain-containing protein n=1 Tax=uncultured Reyranella sp. TaxID=735512 RepID=UPI00259CBE42|nr:STAS domain-containing protein [uncultured Reyranella sp.]
MSSVNRRQPISTVMLPAKVDSVTVASVEVMLVAALRPGARVIVDGSQVNYMSAAGVRTFASVLHKAVEADARIVFCRFAGAAWDCLLVSGFSELLEIASTLEEATARLEKETQRLGGESLHRRGATG